MREITRDEAIETLLTPQVESMKKEYAEKAEEELEEEFELNFGEKVKIVR